jgi:hypothetical protein
MPKVWLRQEDKLEFITGSGLTEFGFVKNRKSAHTFDDEAEARRFLARNRSKLEKLHPGYVWSVEKFYDTRRFPYFAICGEPEL